MPTETAITSLLTTTLSRICNALMQVTIAYERHGNGSPSLSRRQDLGCLPSTFVFVWRLEPNNC